jgi:hypothetical protein
MSAQMTANSEEELWEELLAVARSLFYQATDDQFRKRLYECMDKMWKEHLRPLMADALVEQLTSELIAEMET